jgi:hypothetical protein
MANATSARDVGFDPASGVSYSADTIAISADGRYVAFSSRPTNLVPAHTNGVIDRVRDDEPVEGGALQVQLARVVAGRGSRRRGVVAAVSLRLRL